MAWHGLPASRSILTAIGIKNVDPMPDAQKCSRTYNAGMSVVCAFPRHDLDIPVPDISERERRAGSSNSFP